MNFFVTYDNLGRQNQVSSPIFPKEIGANTEIFWSLICEYLATKNVTFWRQNISSPIRNLFGDENWFCRPMLWRQNQFSSPMFPKTKAPVLKHVGA